MKCEQKCHATLPSACAQFFAWFAMGILVAWIRLDPPLAKVPEWPGREEFPNPLHILKVIAYFQLYNQKHIFSTFFKIKN